MTRRVNRLVVITLAVALLTVGPAGTVFGAGHWLCGAVGFGLALPPAVGTLALTVRLARRSPYGALAGMALGPLVRTPVVLVGAAAVFASARDGTFGSGPAVDELGHPLRFWLWVLWAYMVTLVTETVLLATPLPAGERVELSEASNGSPSRG